MAKILGYESGSKTFGYDHTNNKGKIIAYEPKGNDITMLNIMRDNDTGESYYTVQTQKLDKTVELEIPERDAKDKIRLLRYAVKGLDVNSDNAQLFVENISVKEKEYIENQQKVQEAYSRMGVRSVMIDDGTGARESRVYCGDRNPINGDVYCGSFDLKPEGDAEEYFCFIKEEITNHIALEFMIMAGISGVINGYLMKEKLNQNFIIHLVGDSSTGKSTAMQLAISTLGNPKIDCAGGLIQSYHSTGNALLRRLMQGDGVSFGIDEISMLGMKDCSPLIYAIANGAEKGRLTRNSELQDRLMGTYVVISTGEAGLLSKASSNDGLPMRVLEFRSMEWTESAEQCERIQNFISKNYGHLGTAFGYKMAYWLLDSANDLVTRYQHWREHYCSHCTIQARKERISGRYAMILLAGDLLNEFFGFGLHVEEVCDFIIVNENEQGNDRDSYNNFYDRLISLINANTTHFWREEEGNPRKTITPSQPEDWGKIVKVTKDVMIENQFARAKVLFRTNIFEREVKKMGEEDVKTMITHLKSKGYLDYEQGRNTRTLTINGIKEKVYAIYLLGDESPIPEKKARDREKLENQFANLSLEEREAIQKKALENLDSAIMDEMLKEFEAQKKKKSVVNLLEEDD